VGANDYNNWLISKIYFICFASHFGFNILCNFCLIMFEVILFRRDTNCYEHSVNEVPNLKCQIVCKLCLYLSKIDVNAMARSLWTFDGFTLLIEILIICPSNSSVLSNTIHFYFYMWLCMTLFLIWHVFIVLSIYVVHIWWVHWHATWICLTLLHNPLILVWLVPLITWNNIL
jgi:hypothetical protein